MHENNEVFDIVFIYYSIVRAVGPMWNRTQHVLNIKYKTMQQQIYDSSRYKWKTRHKHKTCDLQRFKWIFLKS